jgi:hypothetical protein
MKRTLRLLPLPLICTAGLLALPAGGPAADPTPRTETDAELVGKNVELVATAFKLKEHGWGKDGKGGIEGGSLESLIAAARILRQVPALAKLDARVEVGKEGEKGPTPGAETPKAEAVDLVAESSAILQRAREILQQDVTDPKKQAAYELLIADAEAVEKGVRGGPRAISRILKPGEKHTYRWDWYWHLPGSVGFAATRPVRIQVLNENTENVYAYADSLQGFAPFVPGGPGKPDGRTARLMIRLSNQNKLPLQYRLFAN